MSKKEIAVSRIKLSVISSDKTNLELTNTVPKAVIDDILDAITGWKDRYSSSYNDMERYQKLEQEFIKEIEKDK